MIAFLCGIVQKKEVKSLLLNVQGVGYRVFCAIDTITNAQEKKEILLYTHHHIREDAMNLFGFMKEGELQFFEKLISVSGIGPKTALDILEVPSHLVIEALEQSDVSFLKTLKGIGKKTAERMIVELRGNLPPSEDAQTEMVPPEVIQALTDLGFEKNMIHKTFRELEKPLASAEEMVKWFLQKGSF